jgi:hypothetical protein
LVAEKAAQPTRDLRLASRPPNGSFPDAASQHARETKAELGLVVAKVNGTVEIRNYRNGQIGTLLGSEAVKAGGNPNVDVELTPSFGDAIAILKVGGNSVDTEALNFSRN